MEVELVRELYTYTNRTAPKREAIGMKETQADDSWWEGALESARAKYPVVPIDEFSFQAGIIAAAERELEDARLQLARDYGTLTQVTKA